MTQACVRRTIILLALLSALAVLVHFILEESILNDALQKGASALQDPVAADLEEQSKNANGSPIRTMPFRPTNRQNGKMLSPSIALSGILKGHSDVGFDPEQPYLIESSWVQGLLSASITESPQLVPRENQFHTFSAGSARARSKYEILVKRRGLYALRITHPVVLNSFLLYQATGVRKKVSLQIVKDVRISAGIVDSHARVTTDLGHEVPIEMRGRPTVILRGPFFLPLRLNLGATAMVPSRTLTIRKSDADRVPTVTTEVELIDSRSGLPVEGAILRASLQLPSLTIEDTYRSDGLGRVQCLVAADRPTYIEVFHPLYSVRCASIRPSTGSARIRITLNQKGMLGGLIVDGEGAPLEGIDVYVFEKGVYAPRMYGRTNEEGRFVLGDLRSSWYATSPLGADVILAVLRHGARYPAYLRASRDALQGSASAFVVDFSPDRTRVKVEVIERGSGSPVPGAMVRFIPVIDGDAYESLERVPPVKASAYGECSVDIPRTSGWLLVSNHPEAGSASVMIDRDDYVERVVIEHDVVSMSIRVKVVETDGTPVQNALLYLDGDTDSGMLRRKARTDREGIATIAVERQQAYSLDLGPLKAFVPLDALPTTVVARVAPYVITVQKVSWRDFGITVGGVVPPRAAIAWARRFGSSMLLDRDFLWLAESTSIPIPGRPTRAGDVCLVVLTATGLPKQLSIPATGTSSPVYVDLVPGPSVTLVSGRRVDRIVLMLERVPCIDQEISAIGVAIRLNNVALPGRIGIPHMCPGQWLVTATDGEIVVCRRRFTVTRQEGQVVRIE